MDSSHLLFVTAPEMDGYARTEDSRNKPEEGMARADGVVAFQVVNRQGDQL